MECEWYGNGVYNDEEIDAYDEFLDEATSQLVRTHVDFSRENMEETLDTFTGALAADQILPDDFN